MAACSICSQLCTLALMPRAFSSACFCCSVGACGLSALANGRNTWRSDTTVPTSRPISRLACRVTMENPPGTFTGLLIAPDRHFGDQARHLGIELIGLHPAQRATLQRRLVLAELRGDHREGRAGAQLADHRLGEALRVGRVGGIVDRNEDLADAVFGLADLLRQQPLLLGHLGIGDLHLVAELLAQHLGPAELRADLVDQRAQADAVRRRASAAARPAAGRCASRCRGSHRRSPCPGSRSCGAAPPACAASRR